MTFIWIILIGFCASFVGTLAGSGGLIGMPLLLLTGIPVHSAIASAKFANIISSFSSFYYLLKNGEIQLRITFIAIPIAGIGGLTGALIANFISQET